MSFKKPSNPSARSPRAGGNLYWPRSIDPPSSGGPTVVTRPRSVGPPSLAIPNKPSPKDIIGHAGGAGIAPSQLRHRKLGLTTPNAYQFRQRLKHVNAKPPAMMPADDNPKSKLDSQAPIIPPRVMQASNQEIQIGRLFIGDRQWVLRSHPKKLHNR